MIKMAVSFMFGAIAIFGFLHSTQSVCLLEDAPNQCGSFCLAALRPIMDHNVRTRNQWNSQGVALNETLERLNKFHGSLTEKLDKLEIKLQAVQTNMESKLQTVLLAIESKQQTVQDNAESKRVFLQGTLSKIMSKIDLSSYEPIGTRLLYIEETKGLNYTSAENACRDMDGQLATFHNEQEISDIKGKLRNNYLYWLGINDLAKKGEDISLASGKIQTFFDWSPSQPNPNKEANERCLGLLNYQMDDYPCSVPTYFICQADEF